MLSHSLVIANFSEQILCKDLLWQVTTIVIGMMYILKHHVRGLQINFEISRSLHQAKVMKQFTSLNSVTKILYLTFNKKGVQRCKKC